MASSPVAGRANGQEFPVKTVKESSHDFEHSTLSMLIAAARRHVKHAVGTLGEPYGLNPYQYWMLWILREQSPLSLSELADRMWMDHPTTSRLVHALEADGYLQVSPDPKHGRRISISIPAAKKPKIEEICGRASEYRSRFEEGLSSTELDTLRSALCKVILNLEGLLQQWESDGTKGKQKAR